MDFQVMPNLEEIVTESKLVESAHILSRTECSPVENEAYPFELSNWTIRFQLTVFLDSSEAEYCPEIKWHGAEWTKSQPLCRSWKSTEQNRARTPWIENWFPRYMSGLDISTWLISTNLSLGFILVMARLLRRNRVGMQLPWGFFNRSSMEAMEVEVWNWRIFLNSDGGREAFLRAESLMANRVEFCGGRKNGASFSVCNKSPLKETNGIVFFYPF